MTIPSKDNSPASEENIMGFKGKATSSSGSGDSNFEIPPDGNHPAVLVAMIDLGTQREQKFEGTGERDVHQLYLVWELTAEKRSADDDNHLIGNKFNLSYHEKGSLRLLAEKLRGKTYKEEEEIDYGGMVGSKCLVTIEHKTSKKDKVYAKFAGASRPVKGMVIPPPKRTPIMWELGESDLADLPDWLPYIFGEKPRDVIDRAAEWKEMPDEATDQAVAAEAMGGEEIPF